MKKEIREKVIEFKEREETLIITINENPEDSKLKAELMNVRKEKRDWLSEFGGKSDIKNPVDLLMLDELVWDAEREISRAAKKYAELTEYISQSARRVREPQPGYERVVDDKSQMAALAEQSAFDKVRKIEKFNKKRNKKSFLNVVICKFKKSKMQEQSQEQQGPSQR